MKEDSPKKLNSKKITEEIRKILYKNRNDKKAEWLENYVKHNIKSLGVGIPEIRAIIQQANKKHFLNESPFAEQKVVLDQLMSQDYTEEKLAAIIHMQLFLKNTDVKLQLSLISDWFDKKWVYDWNVCDWLCVRLLTPLLDSYSDLSIRVFLKWNKDKYLWKARASLVPFAQSRYLQKHLGIVEQFSKVLIRREERFCKTAVGWVLREVSRFNKGFVIEFLGAHKNFTTPEIIRNATRYF